MGWRAPPSRWAIPSEDLGRSGTEGVPVTSCSLLLFTSLHNDVLENLSIIATRVTLANFEQLCHTVTNCVRRSGEIDRRAKRRAIVSPKASVCAGRGRRAILGIDICRRIVQLDFEASII